MKHSISTRWLANPPVPIAMHLPHNFWSSYEYQSENSHARSDGHTTSPKLGWLLSLEHDHILSPQSNLLKINIFLIFVLGSTANHILFKYKF